MNRKQILMGAGLILVLFFAIPLSGEGVTVKSSFRTLQPGDPFPQIPFPYSFTPEDKKYLGIGEKKKLSLNDIQTDLLVIEFLDTNCRFCIKSLPVLKEIFEMIGLERNSMKKVKMIGIAVGNTSTEVAAFKKQYTIPYPIIPDTEFKAHKAVKEPMVPFIVVAKRDKQGKWGVETVHAGVTFSAESFVGELKEILAADPNTAKKN